MIYHNKDGDQNSAVVDHDKKTNHTGNQRVVQNTTSTNQEVMEEDPSDGWFWKPLQQELELQQEEQEQQAVKEQTILWSTAAAAKTTTATACTTTTVADLDTPRPTFFSLWSWSSSSSLVSYWQQASSQPQESTTKSTSQQTTSALPTPHHLNDETLLKSTAATTTTTKKQEAPLLDPKPFLPPQMAPILASLILTWKLLHQQQQGPEDSTTMRTSILEHAWQAQLRLAKEIVATYHPAAQFVHSDNSVEGEDDQVLPVDNTTDSDSTMDVWDGPFFPFRHVSPVPPSWHLQNHHYHHQKKASPPFPTKPPTGHLGNQEDTIDKMIMDLVQSYQDEEQGGSSHASWVTVSLRHETIAMTRIAQGVLAMASALYDNLDSNEDTTTTTTTVRTCEILKLIAQCYQTYTSVILPLLLCHHLCPTAGHQGTMKKELSLATSATNLNKQVVLARTLLKLTQRRTIEQAQQWFNRYIQNLQDKGYTLFGSLVPTLDEEENHERVNQAWQTHGTTTLAFCLLAQAILPLTRDTLHPIPSLAPLELLLGSDGMTNTQTPSVSTLFPQLAQALDNYTTYRTLQAGGPVLNCVGNETPKQPVASRGTYSLTQMHNLVDRYYEAMQTHDLEAWLQCFGSDRNTVSHTTDVMRQEHRTSYFDAFMAMAPVVREATYTVIKDDPEAGMVQVQWTFQVDTKIPTSSFESYTLSQADSSDDRKTKSGIEITMEGVETFYFTHMSGDTGRLVVTQTSNSWITPPQELAANIRTEYLQNKVESSFAPSVEYFDE